MSFFILYVICKTSNFCTGGKFSANLNQDLPVIYPLFSTFIRNLVNLVQYCHLLPLTCHNIYLIQVSFSSWGSFRQHRGILPFLPAVKMLMINRREVHCLQLLLLLVTHLLLWSSASTSGTVPDDFFYHNFLKSNESKGGINSQDATLNGPIQCKIDFWFVYVIYNSSATSQ